MPSRFGLLALLPLASALAACGSSGGTSAPTPPKPVTKAAAPTQSMTITVTSVLKRTHSQRQSPKVNTAGDTVIFEDRLLNVTPGFGKGAKEEIGSDKGTMTFTSEKTARMEGVATLPDGKIVFSGAVTVLPDNTISIPVTGGTGTYENASGTLVVGVGKKQAPNTFKLVVAGVPGPIA